MDDAAPTFAAPAPAASAPTAPTFAALSVGPDTPGREIPAPPDRIAMVLFSPDGSLVATASRETKRPVVVRRVSDLSIVATIEPKGNRDEKCRRLAFSPDGTRLASIWEITSIRSTAAKPFEVRAHSVATGFQLGSVAYARDDDQPTSVYFSVDGEYVVVRPRGTSGSLDTYVFYDATMKKPLATYSARNDVETDEEYKAFAAAVSASIGGVDVRLDPQNEFRGGRFDRDRRVGDHMPLVATIGGVPRDVAMCRGVYFVGMVYDVSRDGGSLAIGTTDGGVRLFDLADPISALRESRAAASLPSDVCASISNFVGPNVPVVDLRELDGAYYRHLGD